jgi:hypothetical protein
MRVLQFGLAFQICLRPHACRRYAFPQSCSMSTRRGRKRGPPEREPSRNAAFESFEEYAGQGIPSLVVLISGKLAGLGNPLQGERSERYLRGASGKSETACHLVFYCVCESNIGRQD